MEPECRAPIMQHEHNVAVETECVEPGVETGCMIRKAVRAGGGGSGLAHDDEIRSKAATEIADMRNDVSPKIRPGRVAMEKHDWHPLSRLDIADFGPCNAYPPTRMRVVRIDHHCHRLDLRVSSGTTT